MDKFCYRSATADLKLNNNHSYNQWLQTCCNLVSGIFWENLFRFFIALRWSAERWPSGMSDRLVQTGGYQGNGCCCPGASPWAVPSRGWTLLWSNTHRHTLITCCQQPSSMWTRVSEILLWSWKVSGAKFLWLDAFRAANHSVTH